MKKWLLLLMLLLGGSFLFIFHFIPSSPLSAQEKQEALTSILEREPILEEKEEQQWKTYKGEHLAFVYPATATVHSPSKSEAFLESFQASSISPRVSLTVQVQQGTVLSENSAVRVRREQTDLYSEEAVTMGNGKGIVFSKQDETVEKTAFFTDRDNTYSIAVTGYQLREVNELFDKVMSSVVF